MTNWERYFGSPEAAMRMGVRMMTWPLEYAAWLHAEYDDGTIRWDE